MGDKRLLTTHRAGQQFLALKPNIGCKFKSELKPTNSVLLHLVLTQKNCIKCKPEAKSSEQHQAQHTQSQFSQRIWWMLCWQIFPVWNSAKLSKVNHITGSALQFTPLASQGWCNDHYSCTFSHVRGPDHNLSYWSGTLMSKLISTSAPQNLLSSSCPWPS